MNTVKLHIVTLVSTTFTNNTQYIKNVLDTLKPEKQSA